MSVLVFGSTGPVACAAGFPVVNPLGAIAAAAHQPRNFRLDSLATEATFGFMRLNGHAGITEILGDPRAAAS